MQITTGTPISPLAPATPGSSSAAQASGAEPSAFAQLLAAQQPAARGNARGEPAAETSGQDAHRPAPEDAKQPLPDEPHEAPAMRRTPCTARDARDARAARDARTHADSRRVDTEAEAPSVPALEAVADDDATREPALPASAHAVQTPPPASEGPPAGLPPALAPHATAPAGHLPPPPAEAGTSEAALEALAGAPGLAAVQSTTARGPAGGPARAALPASAHRTAAPSRDAAGVAATPAPQAEEAPDHRLAGAASASRTESQVVVAAEPTRAFEAHAIAAAAGVQGTTHTGAQPSPVAPASVEIPTPATAPEFRQALGVQVSVLAREGVQHAELHLNPADMGPISVHIALEGSRAHVDFGADSPATRSLIESGLPELAAAMREAGFTLSGGGVSQHARGQQQNDAWPDSRAGTPGVAASREAMAPRRMTARVGQGAVDLYA